MADMRKSKIRKSIVRKLNTAKYETLDIIVDQEHEIEWGTVDELMKKSASVTKLVVKDYMETEAQVLADLNLTTQNGFAGEGSAKRPITKSELSYDRV